jgi:hypothetical protein
MDLQVNETGEDTARRILPSFMAMIGFCANTTQGLIGIIWRKKMSPKVAHVIIVGLSEEECQELDKKTIEILRFVDVNWQYHSQRCDTIDDAFELAEALRNIDVIYIGRRDPSISISAEHDHILGLQTRFKGQKPPTVSYPYGDGIRHKLPVAIMSLWKDRNKTPK